MGTTVPMAQPMIDLAGTPERFPMADDAVVWHNHDQVEQPWAAYLPNYLALRAAFPDFRFEEARVIDCGDVSVARWVFTVTLPDGSVLRAPGCSFVHARDGLVVRVEEYIDSAQLAPVAAVLGSSKRPSPRLADPVGADVVFMTARALGHRSSTASDLR